MVHITTPQPEPFAGPESSPIQQEEQGTIRQWLQGESCRRQDDRRVQQTLELLMRVDVGSKRVLRAWSRLWQRGDGKMASAHQIGEEATEGLVFIFPKARGGTCPTAKGVTGFRGNGVEGEVAARPSEGTQNSGLCRKDGSHGPLERHVRCDGAGECHVNPPRLSKATRRKAVRLAFA